GRVAAVVSVRRARFGGGRAYQPSRRGDVSRPHRRDDRQDQPVRDAAAPLYRGAVVGRADPEGARQGPPAGDPQGRRAEPDQPALGLPFPPALPLRDATLPGRRASVARGPAGPSRVVPPARCRRAVPAGRGRGGRPVMTLDEFLRWDDGTETRYELIDGVPTAIGLSFAAQRILAVRLASRIEAALSARPPCNTQLSAGVTAPGLANCFFVADIAATCAPIEPTQQSIHNPFLIIEILSP